MSDGIVICFYLEEDYVVWFEFIELEILCMLLVLVIL